MYLYHIYVFSVSLYLWLCLNQSLYLSQNLYLNIYISIYVYIDISISILGSLTPPAGGKVDSRRCDPGTRRRAIPLSIAGMLTDKMQPESRMKMRGRELSMITIKNRIISESQPSQTTLSLWK